VTSLEFDSWVVFGAYTFHYDWAASKRRRGNEDNLWTGESRLISCADEAYPYSVLLCNCQYFEAPLGLASVKNSGSVFKRNRLTSFYKLQCNYRGGLGLELGSELGSATSWRFTTVINSSSDNDIACRIVNIWNSLPNYVIDANTVDIFKTRLDKFWKDQEVFYDFTCDITGSGDRSER